MVHRPDRSGPRWRRVRGARLPVRAAEPTSDPVGPGRFTFAAPADGDASVHMVAVAGSATGPAVLAITIDGRLASHAVVPPVGPVPVAVSLGRVGGWHVVEIRPVEGFASAAVVVPPTFVFADRPDPAGIALRHAPILYGRTLPALGGPLQNAWTDVPFLAWHAVRPERPDGRVLEFTVLWSHEDGGTDGPTLMARWGRTTDIEWVYQVAVDRAGRRIPGSAVCQGPGHTARPFAGRYEDDHPLLQVCTENNMVSDRITGSMRFAPAADGTLPPGRARELVMELQPWTFAASAAEVEAGGAVEPGAGARSPALGDARDYLYLEALTRREPIGGPRSGLALGVRLTGDPTVYRSDHGLVDRAILRDGPVSTAVKLPSGATLDDVAAVLAFRVPFPGARDRIAVDGMARAFFLDRAFRPGPSLAGRGRPARLTPTEPQAVLWEPAEAAPDRSRACRHVPRTGRSRRSLDAV